MMSALGLGKPYSVSHNHNNSFNKMSHLRRSLTNNLKKRMNPLERQYCNYVHRICFQNRLEGYNYCIRHILEDKLAPFRQCNYNHIQSRKRCMNAAPRNDKKDSFLCPFHAKITQRNKVLARRRRQPAEIPHVIIDALEEHRNENSVKKVKNNKDSYEKASRLLETFESCSESESDRDLPVAENAWKGDADSDAEVTDGEHDDPLKHAGTYTTEEVALILRDKLIRLQSLYIGQFKRLQRVLGERRQIYLQASKLEGPACLEEKAGGRDMKLKLKVEALQHYNKACGQEALLKRKSHERRRAMTDGLHSRHLNQAKCTFQEAAKKCGESVIPLSKYCFKHILNDSHQVLFTPCQPKECLKPVVPYLDKMACLVHSSHDGLVPEKNPLGNVNSTSLDINHEPELFQSMDDIAALGLDVVQPGSLFGLNQYGDLGESIDSNLC